MGAESMENEQYTNHFRIIRRVIRSLNNRGMLNWLPDKMSISLLFWAQLGYRLDWNNLRTFNEKIQWLKLYDRNPQYSMLVDKYAVREYVSAKIGQEYLIPCFGVWESAKQIDFSKLPDQFVLKCTHDQGSVRICKNTQSFDYKEAKNYLDNRCKRNAFFYGREWPYKNVTPRVMAEKYLIDENSSDLYDYKIHCFSGVPKIILVCSERGKGLKEDWFDAEWKHLPIRRPTHENSGKMIEPPAKLNEMLWCAEKLSEGKAFSRIDFYFVNGNIYFGEITFYPTSGYTAFVPEEYDRILGDYIQLQDIK